MFHIRQGIAPSSVLQPSDLVAESSATHGPEVVAQCHRITVTDGMALPAPPGSSVVSGVPPSCFVSAAAPVPVAGLRPPSSVARHLPESPAGWMNGWDGHALDDVLPGAWALAPGAPLTPEGALALDPSPTAPAPRPLHSDGLPSMSSSDLRAVMAELSQDAAPGGAVPAAPAQNSKAKPSKLDRVRSKNRRSQLAYRERRKAKFDDISARVRELEPLVLENATLRYERDLAVHQACTLRHSNRILHSQVAFLQAQLDATRGPSSNVGGSTGGQ